MPQRSACVSSIVIPVFVTCTQVFLTADQGCCGHQLPAYWSYVGHVINVLFAVGCSAYIWMQETYLEVRLMVEYVVDSK